MSEIRAKRKGDETTDVITFLASFPPIQSAIKRGQDGMRIQLDIPESEMGNAVALIALMSKVLRVTIAVEDVMPVPEANGKTTRDFKVKAVKRDQPDD